MKKIFFMCFIVSCIATLITGCSKGGGTSINPPPPPPSGPTAPTVLILKADTALYNGSATITVTTDGQSVKMGNQVVNGSVTITGLKSDTTLTFTATNTNQYGSASKSASITVHVYSAKTTQLQGYTPLHFTYFKWCIAGTENNPNTIWIDGLGSLDPNFWIKFFADGGGQTQTHAGGPVYTYPAGTGWGWVDATEQAIDFGPANPPGDKWNVTLLSNGIDRSQVKNGNYMLQKLRQ